jgi:hypothetical protein
MIYNGSADFIFTHTVEKSWLRNVSHNRIPPMAKKNRFFRAVSKRLRI